MSVGEKRRGLSMELRKLQYFVEIIKTQNYSNAAKNLFVTQPTLSWNMTKLQEELGVRLLYQVGNKVMPTTAGNILYVKGLELLAQHDLLIEAVTQSHQTGNKELVIGSNAVISPAFMPLIQKFIKTYPTVSVVIEEAGSVKTQQKVANEELELGIVSFPVGEPDLDIEHNLFHSFHYDANLLVRNDHYLANKPEIRISELRRETFCSMTKDYVLWHYLKNAARENGFTPKIELLSNNHDILINHILTYNSIAILPIQLKKAYLDKPLTWIPLKEKIKPFDIIVIHKKGKVLSPLVALCLEFLTTQPIDLP